MLKSGFTPRRLIACGSLRTGSGLSRLWRVLVLLVVALVPFSARADFTVYVTDVDGNFLMTVNSAGVDSVLSSSFNDPQGVVSDASGNLYVANYGNGTVSLVTSAGVVSTYASGFNNPSGLAFDKNDNLYVTNTGNGTVSKVTPGKVITTFASGFSFQVYRGTTLDAQGLAFDGNGNLYVANSGNGTISEVTPAGVVSTFASGFSVPTGLAFDGDGNLYVASYNSGTVSVVTPAGGVSIFASGFSLPTGLAFDGSGNLYVANFNGGEVIVVTGNGIASSFNGGQQNSTAIAIVSTPAAPTVTRQPLSPTVAVSENTTFTVGVSGAPGSNIFKWQRLPAGSSTWVNLTDGGSYAGSATPTLTVSNAVFVMTGDQFRCVVTNTIGPVTTNPAILSVVAVDITAEPQNQVVIGSHTANFSVQVSGANLDYKWQDSTDGGTTWTELADNGTYSGVTTPLLTVSNPSSAQSGYEYECVITNSSGSATSNAANLTVQPYFMYVTTTGGSSVQVLAPNGAASTVGSGLNNEQDLTFDQNGNLYVVNGGNSTVSKITPAGVVSTYASGFDQPQGLIFDANGNLYVANGGNGTISKITPAGVVSAFASGFNNPQSFALDGNGNLYVADWNNKVWVITPAGVVSTFASGFNEPSDLAFDGSNNLYVANSSNGTIAKVTPAGVVSIFVSKFMAGNVNPTSMAFDGNGNLYVAGDGLIYEITPTGAVSIFDSKSLGSNSYLTIVSAPALATITAQPQAQTVVPGASANFAVGVSGVPGGNSFQWQRLPAGSATWVNLTDGVSYSGSAGPTLTVNAATYGMSGDQFQCVITNPVGPVTTQPVPLTVFVVPVTQPQNKAVITGYTTTINVGANGADIGFQWQDSIDGGVTWTALTDNSTYQGSSTPTLIINNATLGMSTNVLSPTWLVPPLLIQP
jgi:sugar lactone lactonase YvrE